MAFLAPVAVLLARFIVLLRMNWQGSLSSSLSACHVKHYSRWSLDMAEVKNEVRSILLALAYDEGYEFDNGFCHFCKSEEVHSADCLIMRARALFH